jgi:hypothetical protein
MQVARFRAAGWVLPALRAVVLARGALRLLAEFERSIGFRCPLLWACSRTYRRWWSHG